MMKNIFILTTGFLFGGISVWLWPQEQSALEEIPVETRSIRPPPPAFAARQSDNPPISFSELKTLRSDFEQTLALYRLMEGQDTHGLVALLEDAKNQLNGGDFVAASGILYARLAELDPNLALSRVLARPGTAQSSWLHSVFHSWARIDLKAATLAAEALISPFKQIAGRALLVSRSDLSTAEQSQIASDLSIQSPPVSSGSDFSQVWQEALSHSNPNQQAQRLMQIASMWAANDPNAAMRATDTIPSASLRRAIQGQIAVGWVTQEPDAALDWVLRQKRSPQSNHLIKQVFQGVASLDPLAAQQRANQLTGRQRDQAILGVVGSLAVADPQAATQWLEELGAPEMRMQAIQSIAMTISQASGAKADEWLATLAPNETQMAEAILSAMTGHIDPKQAARRVENMDDSRRRKQAAQSLVNNWAQQDVDATADWIQTLPSDERSTLYKSLTEHWGQWDPDEARRFVERLPNIGDRDHAHLGLLGAAPSFDDAQSIYNEISDEDLKKQAAIQLYYKFGQSHPEEAEIYRRGAGIPDSSEG